MGFCPDGVAEPGHGLVPITPSSDTIVREAAAMIGASLDTGTTLRAIADAAGRALGADRASAYEYDPVAGVVVDVHTTEADPRVRRALEWARGRGPDDLPLWRMVLQDDPIVTVEDVSRWPGLPAAVAARLGSGAIVGMRLERPPLTPDGPPGLLGALFCSFAGPRRFSAEERSVARGLANIATLALANARTHAEALASLAHAERLADEDALTGLPNRRVLERRLDALDAAGAAARFAVLILDLDGFKVVNAAHGREGGDACLRAVARTVEAALRPGDLASRIGGEEFVVLLPGTGPKGAWLMAERLRARIADIPMPGCAPLTASVGIAAFPEHGRSVGDAVHAADAAMYEAKTSGRDRCVVFDPRTVPEQADGGGRTRGGHEAYVASVLALAAAVDARDPHTRAHSDRVGAFAAAIAARIGMDGDRVEEVRIAGMLHDVGKVGISDAVLFKNGALTAAEWAEMRRHPEIGANLLVHPELADVRGWVLHHHERPDGRGYPHGLAGDAIPLEALILGIADAYEAMTADRPYRAGMAEGDARAELIAGRGAQFDADLVDAFLAVLDSPAAVDLPLVAIGRG